MRPRKDNTDIVIGGKQLLILQSVFALKDNAYGGQIYRALRDQDERTLMPQIYRALGALEKKGLVKARFVEGSEREQGGTKKVYKLTALGSTVLNASLSQRAEGRAKFGWSLPGLGEGVKS